MASNFTVRLLPRCWFRLAVGIPNLLPVPLGIRNMGCDGALWSVKHAPETAAAPRLLGHDIRHDDLLGAYNHTSRLDTRETSSFLRCVRSVDLFLGFG